MQAGSNADWVLPELDMVRLTAARKPLVRPARDLRCSAAACLVTLEARTDCISASFSCRVGRQFLPTRASEHGSSVCIQNPPACTCCYPIFSLASFARCMKLPATRHRDACSPCSTSLEPLPTVRAAPCPCLAEVSCPAHLRRGLAAADREVAYCGLLSATRCAQNCCGLLICSVRIHRTWVQPRHMRPASTVSSASPMGRPGSSRGSSSNNSNSSNNNSSSSSQSRWRARNRRPRHLPATRRSLTASQMDFRPSVVGGRRRPTGSISRRASRRASSRCTT